MNLEWFNSEGLSSWPQVISGSGLAMMWSPHGMETDLLTCATAGRSKGRISGLSGEKDDHISQSCTALTYVHTEESAIIHCIHLQIEYTTVISRVSAHGRLKFTAKKRGWALIRSWALTREITVLYTNTFQITNCLFSLTLRLNVLHVYITFAINPPPCFQSRNGLDKSHANGAGGDCAQS